MEIIKTINIDSIIYLAGMTIFSVWLLSTSVGSKALVNTQPRRNNMPIYLPLVLMGFSLVSISLGGESKLQTSQNAFFNNFIILTGGLTSIGVILFVTRAFFARGLKGFGLNPTTIYKDLPASFIYLLAVWPLIVAALTATSYIGNLFTDGQYQLKPHQELELISEFPLLHLQILIFVVTVIVVPMLEEMLFRGLLQTTIRSFLRIKQSAWVAIIATSVFFVSMHIDMSHWPALFILSMALGYSYEKSNSLFRPIFIHALFNATSVIMTWIQS
jgi:membrane protease YdiL (CAAX protease family)